MTRSITDEEVRWWTGLRPDTQANLMAAHESGKPVTMHGQPASLVLPDHLVSLYYAQHRAPSDPRELSRGTFPTPFIEPSYPNPDATEDDHDDRTD